MTVIIIVTINLDNDINYSQKGFCGCVCFDLIFKLVKIVN